MILINLLLPCGINAQPDLVPSFNGQVSYVLNYDLTMMTLDRLYEDSVFVYEFRGSRQLVLERLEVASKNQTTHIKEKPLVRTRSTLCRYETERTRKPSVVTFLEGNTQDRRSSKLD